LGAGATLHRENGYHQYRDLHRAIRTEDHWKLIGYRLTGGPQFDRIQLFNLNTDPDEMDDLATVDAYQSKLGELQSLLANERAAYDDPLLQ